MSRRLVIFLIACLVVPAVALAATGDPQKKIVAADQAKARSMVLKRSDFVAGWKKDPASPDSDATCPGFNPDQSDLTLTGEAEANFAHAQGVPSVTSFSNVFASTKDALASWTRNVKPALARCVGYFISEGFKEEGAKVKIVSAGRLVFPKLAPRAAAFKVVARVTVTENGETATLPFTIQVLALGHGRGDVGMIVMSPGAGLAATELRAFGQLLATRLAAAKL